MPTQDALLNTVIEEFDQGRLVAVPGKPGKVYWPVSEGSGASKRYVGLKVTTDRRATQWMSIAKAGRKNAENLSRATRQAEPRLLTTKESFLATPNPRRPEMAKKSSKKSTRRKSSTRRKPPTAAQKAWRAKFGQIGRLAAEIQEERGCQWGIAWDMAKATVESGGRGARANPWYEDNLYLPDETQIRQALVPSWEDDWSDPTMIETALEPAHLVRQNPRRRRRTQYDQVRGPFGARRSVPVNRRNPARSEAAEAMRLYHSGEAASLKEAWAIVKRHRR